MSDWDRQTHCNAMCLPVSISHPGMFWMICWCAILRSAHVEKKGSSKWALLKHVTRTNSIGTCSSELYISSLLKLPPPPRAAICYVYCILSYCILSCIQIHISYPCSKVNLEPSGALSYPHPFPPGCVWQCDSRAVAVLRLDNSGPVPIPKQAPK